MTGLLFAHPEWLAPGLAVVAALAAALGWAIRRSGQSLRSMLGDAVFANPEIRERRRVRRVRDLSLIGALVLLLAGLLSPRIGSEDVQLSTRGGDVVLLFDASRSMDARDVPPSRLHAARRVAQTLLGGLGANDRAALAVFSGRGVLLTPLTPDHAALAEMVPQIETDVVKPGGSNVTAGVIAALDAFEPVDERPRTLVVLTDGEAPGVPIGDALVRAVRSNTRVFALAFGTTEGATIPDHGVPLRDGSGRVVTSRRRTAGLAEIAERSGGQLVIADEWGSVDAGSLLRAVRSPVADAPGDFVAHRITVPMVVPFALAAAILLLLEWLMRGGVSGLRRPLVVAAVATITLASASGENTEARRLVQAGLDHAAHGSWPGARASFLAAALAARDPDLAALAYYDLGVSALREQDFEAARDAFLDALAAGNPEAAPERIARTQWNLEWTLTRLAAPQPPEPEQPAPSPESQSGATRAPQPAPGSPPESQSAEKRPAGTPTGRNEAPRLDEAQRDAWLDQVRDDPRRALRSATFEPHAERDRRSLGSPTW